MKKSLLSIGLMIGLGLSIALGVGACKSLPTLQEQFTTGCGIVNGDLLTISQSPLLTADQQAKAVTARNLNLKICSAGSSIDVADAQSIANTLLPAVASIIQAIPAFPDGTAVALALNTFGPLAVQFAEQMIANLKTTAPAAASTPVAASS